MTYVGDFPPCAHKFVNSNGVILCEWCGATTHANDSFALRLSNGANQLR